MLKITKRVYKSNQNAVKY